MPRVSVLGGGQGNGVFVFPLCTAIFISPTGTSGSGTPLCVLLPFKEKSLVLVFGFGVSGPGLLLPSVPIIPPPSPSSGNAMKQKKGHSAKGNSGDPVGSLQNEGCV